MSAYCEHCRDYVEPTTEREWTGDGYRGCNVEYYSDQCPECQDETLWFKDQLECPACKGELIPFTQQLFPETWCRCRACGTVARLGD